MNSNMNDCSNYANNDSNSHSNNNAIYRDNCHGYNCQYSGVSNCINDDTIAKNNDNNNNTNNNCDFIDDNHSMSMSEISVPAISPWIEVGVMDAYQDGYPIHEKSKQNFNNLLCAVLSALDCLQT